MAESALIVGAGSNLSASLTRLFAREGMRVAIAARDSGKLAKLAAETGAKSYGCDASKIDDVARLFSDIDRDLGAPDIVVYNASGRVRGGIADVDPQKVDEAVRVTAFGGFLVAQQAARRMLARGSGTILFTGASASVKGYALSAPFAMGKFALRGLAQSMARELHPQGIHVAHMVIDGGIKSERRTEPAGKTASLLDPNSIAASYLHVIHQPHSAWSWELELRPWVEGF